MWLSRNLKKLLKSGLIQIPSLISLVHREKSKIPSHRFKSVLVDRMFVHETEHCITFYKLLPTNYFRQEIRSSFYRVIPNWPCNCSWFYLDNCNRKDLLYLMSTHWIMNIHYPGHAAKLCRNGKSCEQSQMLRNLS